MGDDLLGFIIYLNNDAIYSLKTKVLQVPEEKREEVWKSLVEEFKQNHEDLIYNILKSFEEFIKDVSERDVKKATKIYKNSGNTKNRREVILTIIAFIKFFEIYHINISEKLNIEVVPMTYEKLLKLQP